MTKEAAKGSKPTGKEFREETTKKIEQLAFKGTAGVLMGMLGAFFFFMTFVNIVGSHPGLGTIQLNGMMLASGYVDVMVSLGTTYPVLWLIIIGSVLAILFGFVAFLPTIMSKNALLKSSVKMSPHVIALGGVMMITGAAIAAAQFLTASGMGIFIAEEYSVSLAWGLPIEIIAGIMIALIAEAT